MDENTDEVDFMTKDEEYLKKQDYIDCVEYAQYKCHANMIPDEFNIPVCCNTGIYQISGLSGDLQNQRRTDGL